MERWIQTSHAGRDTSRLVGKPPPPQHHHRGSSRRSYSVEMWHRQARADSLMEEHGVSKGYLEKVQFVGGETLQLECEQDTEEWNYKQCHLAPPSRGATLQMDRTPHPLTGARLGDSEITAGPFPSSAAMQPQLELEVKGRPFALPVICLVAPPASERAGHPFQVPYGRPPGIIARISALGGVRLLSPSLCVLASHAASKTSHPNPKAIINRVYL